MRSWVGWRRRRVWALGGVGLLMAGTVSVVLVSIGDPAPALIHWPRPVAAGVSGSPVAGPTERAGQTPLGGATVGAGQALGDPRGTSEPEHADSSVVVSLRDPANTEAVTSRGATVVGDIAGTGFILVHAAGDPAALVAELQQDPSVLAAAPDYGRRTTAVPNDGLFTQYQQSYLNLVRMPAAWDLLTDASSQIVAVIDTGVDAGHPDLSGRLVTGYNAVAPGSPPSDQDGHGTFVAGVIAANANNGIGVAGVAWNGRVMPIKVFAGQLAYDSDIAAGMVWAVNHGARVINLSLGGPADSPLLHAAVRYAADSNVVVVASAGNSGDNTPQYPAAFPEVVAVGATDGAGKLVDFSSYGEWLDVVAPGFNVASTAPGGTYAVGGGTSFSAPIVAGVAALIRAQNPALTEAQVGDRLRAAARDGGPRGIDPYYGYGVLDAARALGAPFASDLPFPNLGSGEPNDVPGRATSVTTGVAMTGTIGVEGDSDWYRYDSPATQTVTVSAGGPGFDPALGQNADIHLELYSGSTRTVVDANGPGDGEAWTGQVAVGSVYVRVGNANGSADPRPYSITVSPASGSVSPLVVDTLTFDTGPREVAVGDVTGDGRDDIVVLTQWMFAASPHDNKVFVLAQNQPGGLGEPVWLTPVQSVVASLTLADVDRDTKLDVVVAGNAGIEWFRQEPDGTMTSQGLLGAAGGSCDFVTASDVNGDGATDLVAIRSSSGAVVLLTHGTGSSFTASLVPDASASLNPIDLAVGDVDGDGRGDVVYVGAGVRVHHNAADGWYSTYHAGVAPSFVYLSSVAVVDVTGDGRADVVATNLANSPNGVVDVLRQNADGSLAAAVMYDAGQVPQAVEADDFDGDGRKDVVVINNGHSQVTILYQQPDGTLGNKESIGVALKQHPDGHGVVFGDLDADGKPEIVAVGDTTLSIISRSPVDARNVVRSVMPVEYSTGAALGTTPQVAFASGVDTSTVNSETVRLVDGGTGATVAGSVSFDAASRTATITPVAPLHPAKPYRIVVDGVRGTAMTGGLPVGAFASTFTTTGLGSLLPLQDFAVRGQRGSAASVSAVAPVGDLDEVIVRYAPGMTAPASPTAGSDGYRGVGGGIMVNGLTPGQTYSFSVWYRDRNGVLSPPSIATLVGTTLTMTGSSATAPAEVTFDGTVSTPAGPGAGVPVSLVAHCAHGLPGGVPVATATGTASGSLLVVVALASPRCNYGWEITNSTQYMGAASTFVRVAVGPNPPPGTTPPRKR